MIFEPAGFLAKLLRFLLPALFCGASSLAVFCTADQAPTESGMVAQLQKLINDNVQQKPGPPEVMPGVSTAIFSDRGLALILWGGFSNPTDQTEQLTMLSGHGNPVYISVPAETRIEPDMLFEACSITKTFTAAAILRYVEVGSIRLDDSMKQWLPETVYLPGFNCCVQKDGYCDPGDAPCPTIEQLLQMTSGIRDFNDGVAENELSAPTTLGWFQEYVAVEDPDKFWLPSFVYQHLDSNVPYAAPGEKFLYSSTNYVLLGVISQNLANYFNLAGIYRELSDMTDLTDTYLGAYDPIPRGTRALGWNADKPGHSRRAFVTAYWAAGGLLSTAENVAKWAFMSQQPGVVLSEESLKLMRDFYVFDPPLEVYPGVEGFYIKGYGLGLTWFVITEEAGLSLDEATQQGKLINLYGHSGGSWAFLSFAFYDVDRRVSYGLMVNKKSPEQFTAFARDYVRIVSSYNPDAISP